MTLAVQFHPTKYSWVADLEFAEHSSIPVAGQMAENAMTGRHCRTALIVRSIESEPLFETLERVFEELNLAYGFEIDGIREPLQLITYDVGDYIGWHIDGGMEGVHSRKISLSLQLSDGIEYSGGNLDFPDGTCHPFCRAKGAVIAFPAFITHSVSKVSRGRRQALVAWSHGRQFV